MSVLVGLYLCICMYVCMYACSSPKDWVMSASSRKRRREKEREGEAGRKKRCIAYFNAGLCISRANNNLFLFNIFIDYYYL
ncbi:hypothetical protein F4809DRAFT_609468, partial [Biscogniauxia mediterranea]